VVDGSGLITGADFRKGLHAREQCYLESALTISADGTSCRKRSRGRREGNCFFNLI